MTGPHLPHAVVVRLYAHEAGVVILTSETRKQLVFEQYAILDVALSAPQGDHYHADVIDLLP